MLSGSLDTYMSILNGDADFSDDPVLFDSAHLTGRKPQGQVQKQIRCMVSASVIRTWENFSARTTIPRPEVTSAPHATLISGHQVAWG